MLHANMGSCSDPVSVSTSQMGSAFEEMLGTLRASLEGATFLTLDIGNVTTIGPSNPAPLGKSAFQSDEVSKARQVGSERSSCERF